MKILGVIPARGGSKGVKDKNIKHLCGLPLIGWSIQAAHESDLTKTIVSTDSQEVAKIAEQLGCAVPFLRPLELSTDSARAIPVMQRALDYMTNLGEEFDAVMMLQPTSPFRRVEDINKAINLLGTSLVDSVISVVDVEGHHPARMKYIDESGNLIDPLFCETYENQPRQELEPMFIRNGAIYLTRTSTLKNNSFKGQKSMGLIMPKHVSVNIDTLFDFHFAEWIYEAYLKMK